MRLSRIEVQDALVVSVVLMMVGVSCCLLPASRTSQSVDVDALYALALLMEGRDLSVALAGYEVFASNGIQIGEGRRRRDGVIDLLSNQQTFPGGEHVKAQVALLRSHDEGVARLGSFCERWGVSDVTWEERDGAKLCWTPVIELRDDPAGLCIPHGSYLSAVGIEKNGLVVTFVERGKDEAVVTGEAIRDLTQALAR